MKTIREKLREANIKITELSFYLDISRPTLYTLLDTYERKEYSSLEKKIFDLFSFIDSTKPLTSPILVHYMINNKLSNNVFIDKNDVQFGVELLKLRNSHLEHEVRKFEIINYFLNTNKFDFIVDELYFFIGKSKKNDLKSFIEYLKGRDEL